MTDTTTPEDQARVFVRGPEHEMAVLGANVPAAADLAIDEVNPLNAHLFRENRWQDHFARLRAEDPIHFNELETAGRYWSITRYDDVRAVDGDWKTFSSEHGITLGPRLDLMTGTAPSSCRSSPWTHPARPSSETPSVPWLLRRTCATSKG